LASGLNSTERTIISSVSYVVALVVSIVMDRTGIALTPVVFVAFAFPFLFGTRTLRLRGALLVAAGISVTGLALFLLYESQQLFR